MESAEQAALSQRWEGGGPPRYLNTRRLDDIALMADRHFDHQAVNTSLSAVLVPQALLDSDPQVVNALRWSEHLDPVFVNNYEVDPTLSWQFYGSTTGFLRRFPAMRWPTNEVPGPARDLHDFRWSSWFVGAATSPKDVVVLLDASGVMSSLARQLARATVSTILDTLTDNDFVNVLTFSDSVQELLPCHKDMLAQATETNRRELKAGLNMNMKSEGVANFTGAFVNAFEILHKYNRTWQGCQCNQAIMLVTAGPPSSFQDVLKQYNWPHMPVRVFTYLVGKDSSSANDMHWIACNNKGYYEHVKAVDEVTEKVLNYVKVMARPMVMYQNDHPIHWTPAYAGGKTNTLLTSSIAEGQLMTSVSTPIFDRRNYSERAANLLGVVGTDIPIRQLSKLVPPYKLGVNGYSFIVNNNGHVLYHPDLRPLFVETLKPNYNNIDLGHVELVDSETVSIENNTLLMDLRHDMIEQKEGETELRVKVHYDDMRRVSTRRHKYFYHPIEDTPFSLGLALPDGYGMYEVLAEQEIKLSQVNVTEYFKGNNWRVHPDWVYCEYNYANEHYFSSPEEQVLHFLARTRRPGWKWMSLRPRAPHRSPEGHTGPKKMEKDSYYCDKTLLQSLVFDAMVTHDIQRSPTSSLKEDKQQGYSMFGVTLSFVATRSGLLRWEEHLPAQQSDPHFSEVNRLAMDETWYKRAVDQHSIEPESFVFSVPFDSGGGQPLVTATHAVFVEHKGHRAPAAVVGLQFQHSVLASHFINITSACTGGAGCKKTCASEELDCYVLDNNGFIILSEHTEHAGMFFGQADGTIMDSLVQDGIYKRVSVTDYQGACVDTRSNVNAGIKLLLPWQSAGWLLQWLLGRMVWLAAQAMFIDPPPTYADNVRDEPDADPQNAESQFYGDDYSQTDFEYDVGVNGGNNAGSGGSNGGAKDTLREFPLDEEVPANSPPPPRAIPPPPPPARPTTQNRTHARPCTKRMELFILQPGRLNNSGSFNPLKGKLTNCHATGCERPFSVQKIPHSNLILLVVDTLCPCGSKQLSIAAQELPASETCARALYRRRPNKCISYHPEEIEIKQCGGCTPLRSARTLTVTASLLLALLQAS